MHLRIIAKDVSQYVPDDEKYCRWFSLAIDGRISQRTLRVWQNLPLINQLSLNGDTINVVAMAATSLELSDAALDALVTDMETFG